MVQFSYFLCILLFREFLMYFSVFATYVFYCFLYGIVWVLNINKYNSDFNCHESNTVEPRYNEVLGTMKITLLYQVSHYIRVKKLRNMKSWDQQNYLVIRGFCYIRPLYNEVPLYCILELKIEFWQKKPFSICFVHKCRKFSNFEPTFNYIMLRNFRTVRPIFLKIAPKVAQDFKE